MSLEGRFRGPHARLSLIIGFVTAVVIIYILATFCATQLQRAGWQVRRTDEYHCSGVNLVAQKDGLVVALQCNKGWSGVNEAAIEKLATGTKLVGADFGVVVANTAYTPHAQQLAAQRGVILMHYTELAKFDPALEE